MVVAFVAGATAAVVGFGIGSLLTPFVATRYGMPAAVAAVAIPHAIASVLRVIRLWGAIDWRVIRTFGVVSALGGLMGALVYSGLGGRTLTLVLGALLLLTASAGLTGWSASWRPRGLLVWTLGALSGFCGGIAGNQGGLRAAALSAFHLPPATFVATATAIAVLVDAGRMPIYLWRAGDDLAQLASVIGVASLGVLAGTIAGERVLLRLSPGSFKRIVYVTIGILGVVLVVQGLVQR